jgi:2-phosphoglycolate phosphatase
MKLYKNNINAAKPFITKDSSQIRSIIDATNARMKNVTLAEARVKPGKTTLAHEHRQTEEIYYFTEGSGRMRLGKKIFPVKAGDGVLIPPGTNHKLYNTGEKDLALLCACSPPYSHEDTFTTENNYKLVIFDFDGTLVDSATGIWATANKMAKKFGKKPFKRALIVSAVGTGLDSFLHDLFPNEEKKMGMKELFKIYRSIYNISYKQGLKIYRNVKETLEFLYAKGLTLAIVSNKLKQYVDGINKEVGISDYFDITLGSGDVKRMKPDPFAVNMLMKKYSVTKKEVLFVGDSQYDVMTARNAGVDCVYLDYGYADRKMIKKLKPEFCLSDFKGLKELI